MTIQLALDGFDGSGKSSLAHALMSELQSQGWTAQVVGHSAENSNQFISDLAEALKIEEVSHWRFGQGVGPRLRAHRIKERLALARDDVDIVIFDRFAYTDFAVMRSECRPIYADILGTEMLFPSRLIDIHLLADFDVLWERISARPCGENSPREKSGRASNAAAFADFSAISQWDEFPIGVDAEHWEVDATLPLDAICSTLLERLDKRLKPISSV